MQASRFPLFISIRSTKGVGLFPYIACKHLSFSECRFSTSGNRGNGENIEKQTVKVSGIEVKIPPPPTNCCMSGCQNCVWLLYAEELRKTLCSSTEENQNIILDQIKDPNMKAFLKFELSHMDGDGNYRPNCPVDSTEN